MLHAKNSKIVQEEAAKVSSIFPLERTTKASEASLKLKSLKGNEELMLDSVRKGQWKKISRAYFINVLRTFHDLECIQIMLLKYYAIAVPCL